MAAYLLGLHSFTAKSLVLAQEIGARPVPFLGYKLKFLWFAFGGDNTTACTVYMGPENLCHVVTHFGRVFWG